MPIPTINLIQPAVGHTAGRNVVRIGGSNFRLPQVPPPNYVPGTTTDFHRTVAVTFGGVAADDVRVLDSGLLTCRPPPSGPSVVDVVVMNLDDDLNPISGESATAILAYTFSRPRIDAEVNQDLTRISRQLIVLFQQQVIQNVMILTDTDFDPETGDASNYVDPAKVPQIVLFGPTLLENRLYYTSNEYQEDDSLSPIIKIRREPIVHDVGFTILGVTDNLGQTINLMAAVERFFHKTKWVVIPKVAGGSNTVQFELDIAQPGGSMKLNPGTSRHNLRSFSGSCLIRGFQTDDAPEFVDDLVVMEDTAVGEINLETTTRLE